VDHTQYLRHDPERQLVEEIEPGVWVMIAKDVTPLDFVREDPVLPAINPYAAWVKFIPDWREEDKSDDAPGWMLPVALVSAPNCSIPTKDRLVRGRWTSLPEPKVEEISAIAETYYLAEKGEAPEPSREWKRDATCRCLALNYAVTPAELSVMGMLCDAMYDAVAGVITDRRAREAEAEAQKKTPTPPDGAGIDSGGTDG
jgi:hypothetical protein